MNISGVIGKAFHNAMEAYYGGNDEMVITSNEEAIEAGMKTGAEYLEHYNDGFINFSTTVQNKQKAQEILSFAFNSYVKEKPWDNGDELISVEELLEEKVNVQWRGRELSLPVKLKGYTDKIIRQDGKLKIIDYKTTRAFSADDKIDGAKMIQAVQYYLLAYAKYGEEPYSMIFEEVKVSKNRDGGSQVREYEIVFAENELFFDFYFRMFEDMTRALNGEMVYVPNINALYDNEVAIIAYIHRLDVDEERAALMKKLKVDNITDLLKKKISNANNMKKFQKVMEQKFNSAKTLNYSKMENEEKIRVKLMEFGMVLDFDSKIEGLTVDLYKFTPSIGLKMAKLASYTADMEQVLGVSGIRILAPIPGTSQVGFEVPRKDRIFTDTTAKKDGFNLAMGVDIMGELYRFDITEAPHILIAGATGSGKSICLRSLLKQLCALPKSKADIYLFDPKCVELALFKNEKNVVEYETDIMEIHASLEYMVKLMNSRYKKLVDAGVTSVEEYGGRMPRKIIVIDEFADLTISKHIHTETKKTGKIFQSGPRAGEEETETIKTNISEEISKNIQLLAGKARASGIHLIIATQRTSTDIISGSIRNNFPVKIAFRMAKAIDSQILLDETGAEKLLGKGDLLFSSDQGTVRLQGLKN